MMMMVSTVVNVVL